MLIFRLLTILGLIALGVTLTVFLITRDHRYLRFFWQVFKICALLAGIVFLGRVLLR